MLLLCVLFGCMIELVGIVVIGGMLVDLVMNELLVVCGFGELLYWVWCVDDCVCWWVDLIFVMEIV